MPQFTYAPTQNVVQNQSVRYNVQPNLSGSRAAQKLEQGILGALQLAGQVKTDIREDNYSAALTEQTAYLSDFNTRWTEASYEEQKSLETELRDYTTQYDTDDRFGQKLFASAITEHGKYASALKTRGYEAEYVSNLTDQTQGLLDLRTEWQKAANVDERSDLLASFNDMFVTPYQGLSDEYSIKLHDNGMKARGDFATALATERTNIADNKLMTQAVNFVTSTVEMDGTMTAEKYNALTDHTLSQLSTYETKGADIRRALDTRIAETISAVASQQPLTWNNALAFEEKMNSFVNDVAPRLKGTDAFNKANNAVLAFKNAVNTNDINRLTAIVNNDQVRWTEVEDLTDELVAREAITPAVADYQLFLKEEKVKVRDVKADIANLYSASDMEGLLKQVERGRRSSVVSVVKGNFNVELAHLAENQGSTEAVNTILQKHKEYRKAGIDLGTLDGIEQILTMNKDGALQSPEDIAMFVDTVNSATQAGYSSAALRSGLKDAKILDVFRDMGVPNIVERFQAYKSNRSIMPAAAKKEALDELLDNEWWAENIHSSNYNQFHSMLMPAIEAAWKAGITASDLDDYWEAALEQDYFEADTGWGVNGRVMIPKRGDLNNDEAYGNALEVYTAKHGDGILTPMNISAPEGKWTFMSESGQQHPVPFEYIAYAAKFGRMKEE